MEDPNNNTHHIPYSAPRGTTLWRYTNQFIITIIIIIKILFRHCY